LACLPCPATLMRLPVLWFMCGPITSPAIRLQINCLTHTVRKHVVQAPAPSNCHAFPGRRQCGVLQFYADSCHCRGPTRQTRRRTGVRLPETPPDATAINAGYEVHSPDGKPITVRLTELEDALGPTILVWPGREGVIVPIAKNYADDLLGTGNQSAALVELARPEPNPVLGGLLQKAPRPRRRCAATPGPTKRRGSVERPAREAKKSPGLAPGLLEHEPAGG
jgi:hypothetical protein